MKKIFLVLILFLVASKLSAQYVAPYKIIYSSETPTATFIYAGQMEIGISTTTRYIILLGTGTARAKEGVFDYLFIAEQMKAKRITSGDDGSVTNVWTKFVSSDSWGETAAGNGGNKIRHEPKPASTWDTPGYTGNSAIVKKEWEVNSSTQRIYVIKLPDSALPNEANTDIIVDREFVDNGTVNAYFEMVSSATITDPGNVWLHLIISTCRFVVSEVYESTTTGASNGWDDGVVSTFTFANSNIWTDGKCVTAKIRRISGDGYTQTVYIKHGDFSYPVD